MIKKIFFPYDRKLSVAFISNEEQNCILFYNLLHSIFDSNDSILNHIGNIQYLKEKDIFNFVMNPSTTIRFSIHNLVISSTTAGNDFSKHDILIPTLRLNKYPLYEYDHTANETDYLLKRILETKKSVIISYLNTECLFENKIETEEQWQYTSNELHKLLINNGIESTIKLTKQGKATIQGLFKVFNYHSRGQRRFGTPRKVNFFVCGENNSEIVYGKNEFIVNLLMQMLNFDKLNSYKFQIK